MAIKFSNNASAQLASSISSGVTSISVQTGQGALFPSLTASDYFFATLADSNNNLEIVKVTGRTGDVLTVVRGQEGTTARAYASGDKIELRPTAQALTDISTGANVADATTSVKGLVQLNNTTNSTSTTQAATANAVKTAYDLANAALPKTGGTLTGDIVGQQITGTVVYCSGAVGGIVAQGRDVSTNGYTIYASGNVYRVYSNSAGLDRFTMDSSGNAFLTGTLTQNSDASFKTNWRDVEFTVDELAGVLAGVYDRTDVEATQVGVSAQELQAILPEAVVEAENGKLAVAYGNAALVACIKLAQEVVALRARVEALEASNA